VDSASAGVKLRRNGLYWRHGQSIREDRRAQRISRLASREEGDHVFLVDGLRLHLPRLSRAAAAEPQVRRAAGQCVLGFCNMLWKLLRDMKAEDKPTHLAVIFDKSEKTFRNELYKEYKAHRPDAPADLIPQFPLIREAVRAFDIRAWKWVASRRRPDRDLRARACTVGAQRHHRVVRQDLMQLVNDCVIMYDTMKDKKIASPR